MQRKTSRRTFLSRSLIGLGAMASCTRAGWARAAHDPAVDRDPSIQTYRELYYPSPGPGICQDLCPWYAEKMD